MSAPGTDTLDLRAILGKVMAMWWLFAITTGLALAGAFVKYKTTPQTFRVKAVLLMSEKSRSAFGGGQDEFIKGMSFLRNSSGLEDQIALLTSRKVIKRTLERLDFDVSYYQTKRFLTTELYDFKPFYVRFDSASLQPQGIPIHVSVDRDAGTYKVRAEGKAVKMYNILQQMDVDTHVDELNIDQTVPIGDPFISEHLSFSIVFPEDRVYDKDTDYYFQLNSLEGMVTAYRYMVSAAPLSKESNIVELSTTGEVISKQRNFLNKLMDTFIELELYKRNQKGFKTIDFIDEQLGSVRDTLSQAERAVTRAQTTATVLGDASVRSEALFADRSRLMDEQGRLESKIQYFRYILDYMRTADEQGSIMAPSASNIDAPVLNNLIIGYINDLGQRAQLNLVNKQPTPQMIALERKIQTTRGAITETAQGLLEQARLDQGQVERRLATINAMFSQLPENTRRLDIARRQYDLSENLYNYLMEKRYEAGIAIASDQVDKEVVDEARMESTGPVAPNKRVLFGGALVLGLALPMVYILLRELFDDRIADQDELKRISPVPVLVTIPHAKRKRITMEEPKSLLAESFRTARINLQYLHAGERRQIIGFTSSASGEGKTFCAVNLATVMAMSGKRTIVLDVDMRRPRVAEALGLPEGDGLSNYLIGECNADDIIRRTDIPGMDVITAGPIPPNPLELVESPRMAELFERLRASYDVVVVDASPMGLVSEYVIVMRHVDVSLYVVRQGSTRRRMLDVLNDHFRSGKISNVSLLLNDVKAKGGNYSSGGHGYYAN